MMTRYYSLRCNGKLLKNRERDLIVGQCGDADLKVSSDPQWEDENYLVIRYKKDSDSWFAVRISENVDIRINGLPMGLAIPLKNGDVIEAGDSTIKFNIVQDSTYNTLDGIVLSSSRFRTQNIIVCSVISVIVLAVLLLGYRLNKEKDVEYWKLSDRELASVKKINVTSIYLQKFENGYYRNIDSLTSYSVSGTCFITRDGKLITARHCIQPWLELNPMDTTLNESQNRLVRFAMEAETARMIEGDSAKRVAVKLCVGSENKILWSYEFKVNETRDLIINNGTRVEPQLWRSISPSYHKRDNELGDIAWIENCGMKGRLRLAGEKQIETLAVNEKLDIVGFTVIAGNSFVTVKDGDTPQSHPGILKRLPIKDDEGKTLSCLFHDDFASKGDSGGPVLIRRGNRYYVISVLSRKDEHRGLLSGWSVPVSEIHN